MSLYLNKKEVAEKIGVSVPTVERYMRKGMPYYKVNGFLVRFKLDEVMNWIEKGE